MIGKPKNDSKSLLRRNALIVSIGLNIVLITMLLVLYVPSLITSPPPPTSLPGTADAFQLTATELIRIATQGMEIQMGIFTTTPTASPEPMPTLSPVDEMNLRNQYLHEIEAEVGFLHPVFEESVDSYIWAVKGDITYYNNNRPFGNTSIPDSIIHDIDRITFENIEYVAVVLPFHRGVGATQGFIFRIQNSEPELLAQAELGIILEPFADRNGNGFPDAAFLTYTGGNHGIYGLDMYEIRPNGEFVNLTENLINGTLRGFVDLEGDGIMEILGFHRLFIPEGASVAYTYDNGIPRWFRWNGEAYEALPLIEGE